MESTDIKKKLKLLMIVGDYVEDYEVMVPFQALQIFDHVVHAVCPDKKEGEFIKTAIHDFEGDQTYSEKPGHKFKLNYDFDKVVVENYDGLIIPGGRAPEYLRLDERVLKMTTYFLDSNKPIAAVCHGIQILTACQGIKGRSLTCYPAVKTELFLAGANYQDIDLDDAYVCGNLVTAKAWPAHSKWLRKFLDLLG
jgi:protease I